MRLVFGFVLLIGIGLAGAAVYMAKDYIGQQQAQLAEAEKAKEAIVPTVEVYVVNKQMRYGQRLKLEDVQKVRWPVEAVPEGAFTSEEELFPKGDEALRSVLRTMEPSEAVMTQKVTKPGEDAGIASRLSPGYRAFTIRTDATSGVSGFLSPGDRVDIFWTGEINDQSVTKLILASIPIIAINQSAEEDRNNVMVADTVTVEVTPQTVAALAQAQATGRLSLSLVGGNDSQAFEGEVAADIGSILGIEKEHVIEAPQEEKCYVRRRNGEEITSVEIPCTN